MTAHTPSYRFGARVRVHGLQSRPQHNDCGGTLLSRQGDRWQVRLDDATELALRPVNLQLEEPPPMPRIFAHQPQVPERQQPEQGPLQMKMLRMVEPSETSLSVRAAHTLICHRHVQRVSLEKLLVLPEGAFTNDPLLNQPSCIILEYIDAERVRPRQLRALSLVCRAWAVGVRAWLVSSAAGPFWQRVCVAMLPDGVVLHPERCTRWHLLEWVRLRPVVGTRQQWYTCGMGLADDQETSAAMSELELAVLLSQLFTLWWNIGIDDDSPCHVGWMRLYFKPWLAGETHETEANPGEWDLQDGPMPMSLLANVCDCIQDFRNCPNVPNVPELIDLQLLKTLRALVTRFRCQTPRSCQWRFMPMSAAQNGAFYALLHRYAPLFPQESDLEPRVKMPPVFRNGERHPYPRPREPKLRLLPSPYNGFLVMDPGNTDEEQECWEFAQRMGGHETGSISDDDDMEDEGEEEEEDDDDDDEEESEGGEWEDEHEDEGGDEAEVVGGVPVDVPMEDLD